MRVGWEAIGAVLILLFSTALAPGAVASGDGDCTDMRYAVTPELSGKVTVCEDPSEVDWDIWPENPLGPAVPGVESDSAACDPGQGSAYRTETGQTARFCFSLDVSFPGVPGVPGLPGPGDGSTRDCPGDQRGEIRENDWFFFGVCTILIAEPPSDTDRVYVSPRITPDHCELSEGPGIDPSISINDGGVVFCVFLHFGIKHLDEDPGGPPPVEHDLEPCRPDAADPAVFVGDAGVRICVWGGVDPGI